MKENNFGKEEEQINKPISQNKVEEGKDLSPEEREKLRKKEWDEMKAKILKEQATREFHANNLAYMPENQREEYIRRIEEEEKIKKDMEFNEKNDK
jgi:hypothetical protein